MKTSTAGVSRQWARLRLAALLPFVLLAACGGGNADGPSPASATVTTPLAPSVCSLADQKRWLRDHVRARYFWASEAPNPAPGGDAESLQDYFESLLFQGNGTFPADRYSGFGSLAAYSQYYDEGTELGYGLAVSGQEIFGQPDQPLYIRLVTPGSPADRAGLLRGDRVWAINQVASSSRLVSQDFADLVPDREGQTVQVEIERAGRRWIQSLSAAVYSLQPVQGVRLVQTSSGQRLAYVYLQGFTQQARDPLYAAISGFAQQGISDMVLDLRYNGGGLVEVARFVGALMASAQARGQIFARLVHNASNANLNETYRFDDPLGWSGFKRIYLLTGLRSCSASEQLIMGLRGAGLEVITVGGTSCGKPVGFTPQSYCDQVYSLVTFETVNARGEGRYFDGLKPTCPAPDRPAAGPMGSLQDPLMSTAISHAQTGVCPAGAALLEPVQRPAHRIPVLPNLAHSPS